MQQSIDLGKNVAIILSAHDKRDTSKMTVSSAGHPPLALSDAISLEVRDNLLINRWRVLRRNGRFLTLLAALGCCVGIILSCFQNPRYLASTVLEFQEVNQDFLNLKNVTPISQDPGAASIDEIQTYIRRLQSRSLLGAAIKKARLPQDGKQPAGFFTKLRSSVGLGERQTDPVESLIDAVLANLNIREIGRSRMVEIAFSSDSANGAAAFANAVADELLDENLKSRGTLTRNVSEWITNQLTESRANLVKSEEKLENYTRTAGLLYLNGSPAPAGAEIPSGSLSTEKLRQVQQELSRAQAERMSKESIYNLAKTAPIETLPVLAGDAALRLQQDKLTDLMRQRAELGTNYTPRYNTMRSLEAQIEVIQAALAKQRSTILRQIENEYRAASGHEQLLLQQYGLQSRVVNGEGVKAIAYQMLKHEVDSNRQLYDDLLQRTKQASVAAALRANNIRIVDAARIPTGPYKPNTPVNAGLGLVGGFLFAAAWVTAYAGDGKIRRPGELKTIAGVSELGAIQSTKTVSKKQDVFSDEEKLLSKFAFLTGDGTVSPIAHEYSSILTSLHLSQPNQACRVIAITSADAIEGKTTILTGLAVVLALMQQRVLVVDGDLYKPDLQERLEVSNGKGLTDLLQEPEGSGAAVGDYIQKTGIQNLSILTSGTAGLMPLLFSEALKKIFTELRNEYDFVLVDTPPLLQIADGRVLGKLSDSVVLVVRAGLTTREAALMSLERLSEDGVPVLGTILNDWIPSPAELKTYSSHGRSLSGTGRKSNFSVSLS